jgi:hypothetical protein
VDGAMAGEHDTIDAGTVAYPQQGTEVSWISDAIDRDDEGRTARASFDERGKVGFGKRRGKCDDTLRCLAARHRLELAAIDLEQLDAFVLGELHDVADDLIFIEIGRHPNFANLSFTRNEQLANGLTPLDLFATKGLFGLAWRCLAGSGDATRTAGAA